MDCQPVSLRAPDCAGWYKSSASGKNLALRSQPVDMCDLPFFKLRQPSQREGLSQDAKQWYKPSQVPCLTGWQEPSLPLQEGPQTGSQGQGRVVTARQSSHLGAPDPLQDAGAPGGPQGLERDNESLDHMHSTRFQGFSVALL